jgi:hypothetical protein
VQKRLLLPKRLPIEEKGIALGRNRHKDSNPTGGALQNYHTAEPTRTKQERPEFGIAVFHKRVNQNIRLEKF